MAPEWSDIKFPEHGISILRVSPDWLGVAKTVSLLNTGQHHDLLSLHDDAESKNIFFNGVLRQGRGWAQNHRVICVGRDL